MLKMGSGGKKAGCAVSPRPRPRPASSTRHRSSRPRGPSTRRPPPPASGSSSASDPSPETRCWTCWTGCWSASPGSRRAWRTGISGAELWFCTTSRPAGSREGNARWRPSATAGTGRKAKCRSHTAWSARETEPLWRWRCSAETPPIRTPCGPRRRNCAAVSGLRIWPLSATAA